MCSTLPPPSVSSLRGGMEWAPAKRPLPLVGLPACLVPFYVGLYSISDAVRVCFPLSKRVAWPAGNRCGLQDWWRDLLGTRKAVENGDGRASAHLRQVRGAVGGWYAATVIRSGFGNGCRFPLFNYLGGVAHTPLKVVKANWCAVCARTPPSSNCPQEVKPCGLGKELPSPGLGRILK